MDPVEARLPTRHGARRVVAWHDGGKEHAALVHGDPAAPGDLPPLVRLHSECLTGDVFGSTRCDCGAQLAEAQARIAAEPSGILLYLRQEGRGIGLVEKVKAYNLQDAGRDTVDANLDLGHPADGRDYTTAAHLLRHLGVDEVRLLTNNPAKVQGLEAAGVRVAARVPLVMPAADESASYMATKAARMGHHLPTSKS